MLHVLPFFLLCTSVFAVPVRTTTAQFNGHHRHYPAEVQPEEASHVIWYPINALQRSSISPGTALEIPTRGRGAIHRLNAADGAVLPNSGTPAERVSLLHLLSNHGSCLCLLPRASIEFALLSSCLSLNKGEDDFVDIPMSDLSSQKTDTITDWELEDFNYWYKVPGPNSHHKDPLPIPVLDFDPNRTLAGVRQLGVHGGVDLGSIIHPSEYRDFKSLIGTYRRVPGPRTPLVYRLDLMEFTVKKVGQGYETTIVVHRRSDPDP